MTGQSGDYEDVCGAGVAGTFYPAAAERLAARVGSLVAAGRRPPGAGPARALIVPHAGYVYSGPTAGRAYACVEAARVSRVVVLAPAHSGGFRGLAVGAFRAFRTPLGEVAVDVPVCRDLCAAGGLIASRRQAFRGEHALEVQLPFLQTVCAGAAVIPLLCGEIGPQDLGALAAELVGRVPAEGTLWLVSSDFTHYGEAFGYAPFTRDTLTRVEQLDRGAIDLILRRDAAALHEYLRATGATICGASAIELLLAILERTGERTEPVLLDYAQSGQMEHDETQSVGYAAIAFLQPIAEPALPAAWAPSGQGGEYLLRLARDTLAAAVTGAEAPLPDPASVPQELLAPRASFVSLHCDGHLRGCMGSLEVCQPLYLDVVNNARNAGFRDPRFVPLQADELPEVDIQVSVLSPLRQIPDSGQFEPGHHGILLSCSGRRALYLPEVALEQGWDRVTTLEHLCRKAGLPANAWRHGARFEVFETRVFSRQKTSSDRGT